MAAKYNGICPICGKWMVSIGDWRMPKKRDKDGWKRLQKMTEDTKNRREEHHQHPGPQERIYV
jgi:adenine-specific DNA methylase